MWREVPTCFFRTAVWLIQPHALVMSKALPRSMIGALSYGIYHTEIACSPLTHQLSFLQKSEQCRDDFQFAHKHVIFVTASALGLLYGLFAGWLIALSFGDR